MRDVLDILDVLESETKNQPPYDSYIVTDSKQHSKKYSHNKTPDILMIIVI